MYQPPFVMGLPSVMAAMSLFEFASDTISVPQPNTHLHKRGRFKMNARRQKGRKVCPSFRKGGRT